MRSTTARTRRSATTWRTPALVEQGDVAVEAASGHVVELGGELGGGERPVAEESLDDAEPHRVQQQVQRLPCDRA